MSARRLFDLKTMIMISDNDKYPSDIDPVNSAEELRAPVQWSILQAMGAWKIFCFVIVTLKSDLHTNCIQVNCSQQNVQHDRK